MYSSYNSYSSMSSATQPMDIAPTSYSSAYTASCGFPSWPQRLSLQSERNEKRASSYLSDDDLFPQDLEDDARSISSATSSSNSSNASYCQATQEDLLELQHEKAAMQREALRFLVNEKEKRRQAHKNQRRSSSKKSPRSQPAAMTPITEAVE